MKKYITYILFLLSVAFMSSCASYSQGRGNQGMPPGQAKKIFGTKSAKPFAPGQRKKHKRNQGKSKAHRGNPGKYKGNQGHRGNGHYRAEVYIW